MVERPTGPPQPLRDSELFPAAISPDLVQCQVANDPRGVAITPFGRRGFDRETIPHQSDISRYVNGGARVFLILTKMSLKRRKSNRFATSGYRLIPKAGMGAVSICFSGSSWVYRPFGMINDELSGLSRCQNSPRSLHDIERSHLITENLTISHQGQSEKYFTWRQEIGWRLRGGWARAGISNKIASGMLEMGVAQKPVRGNLPDFRQKAISWSGAPEGFLLHFEPIPECAQIPPRELGCIAVLPCILGYPADRVA